MSSCVACVRIAASVKLEHAHFHPLIPESRNERVCDHSPHCSLSLSFLHPESPPFALSSQSISVALPTERPEGSSRSIAERKPSRFVCACTSPRFSLVSPILPSSPLFLSLFVLFFKNTYPYHPLMLAAESTTTTSGRCFVPFIFKLQHAHFSQQSLLKCSCSAFIDRHCDVAAATESRILWFSLMQSSKHHLLSQKSFFFLIEQGLLKRPSLRFRLFQVHLLLM